MTIVQQTITVLMCTFATMLTRFLPFIVFNGSGSIPPVVHYLGEALPSAVFAMLVVYCLRNTDVLNFPFGAPELIAGVLTASVQAKTKNMFLAMLAGTLCYMFLVQMIF